MNPAMLNIHRGGRYLLLLAWFIASAEPLRWMLFALAQPAHAVQRMLLVVLAVLGLRDFVRQSASPNAHPHALPIVLAAALVAAIARVGTDVHVMHACASLLLLYALSATYLDAPSWRRRSVLLLATLLCLPIQPHIDAHLGLPLRLWTAQAVAPLLQFLGVANVSVESIIVTENGVADVANACSGVRTLWYALALWLCARIVWPQAAVARWWLAGGISAAIAVGLNVLRVTVLVWALHHDAPPLVAEMAHASLGLMALALVGAVNWRLCRAPITATAPSLTPEFPRVMHHVRWQPQLLLAISVAGVALLPMPSRPAQGSASLHSLNWPPSLHTEPVALTHEEQGLVLGYGATVAQKQRFKFAGVAGSLLVVQSNNWRAHHAPELCLLAQGAHIDQQARVATSNGAYRIVTLQGGAQTAITWFQSDAQVVPDLGARLWAQLWHPQQRWSLVTLVVDGAVSIPAIQNLHQAVHAVVAQHL